MSGTPLVKRPPTIPTYKLLILWQFPWLIPQNTVLLPEQNQKHVGGKHFVLSINQLGPPARLKQLGFFTNKGESHIRGCSVNLSIWRKTNKKNYSLRSNSSSSNNIESVFTFSSYFLSNTRKGSHSFSPLLPFKERGELSMNHPLLLPRSELRLPFVKQREWWKWQRRHLPWTTADREGENEGER